MTPNALYPALRSAAEAESSITLTCTQKHTPGWGRNVYIRLGTVQTYRGVGGGTQHSNTSASMTKVKKKKHTRHSSGTLTINAASSFQHFFSPKDESSTMTFLKILEIDLTAVCVQCHAHGQPQRSESFITAIY